MGGGAGGPPSPMNASAGAGRRVASFDYAATEQGELTFTKGDYITVLTEVRARARKWQLSAAPPCPPL